MLFLALCSTFRSEHSSEETQTSRQSLNDNLEESCLNNKLDNILYDKRLETSYKNIQTHHYSK